MVLDFLLELAELLSLAVFLIMELLPHLLLLLESFPSQLLFHCLVLALVSVSGVRDVRLVVDHRVIEVAWRVLRRYILVEVVV